MSRSRSGKVGASGLSTPLARSRSFMVGCARLWCGSPKTNRVNFLAHGAQYLWTQADGAPKRLRLVHKHRTHHHKRQPSCGAANSVTNALNPPDAAMGMCTLYWACFPITSLYRETSSLAAMQKPRPSALITTRGSKSAAQRSSAPRLTMPAPDSLNFNSGRSALKMKKSGGQTVEQQVGLLPRVPQDA